MSIIFVIWPISYLILDCPLQLWDYETTSELRRAWFIIFMLIIQRNVNSHAAGEFRNYIFSISLHVQDPLLTVRTQTLQINHFLLPCFCLRHYSFYYVSRRLQRRHSWLSLQLAPFKLPKWGSSQNRGGSAIPSSNNRNG